MALPPFKVGDHVKIYRSPVYGREDATCISIVNATTGVINARILKGGPVVSNIVYRDSSTDTSPAYWTDLPTGWLPEG
jgi:hypothetical protein